MMFSFRLLLILILVFLVFVVDFLNSRNNKTYFKAEIGDYLYRGVVSCFHSMS